MKFISLMATMPSRRSNLEIVRGNYLKAVSALNGTADFEWCLVVWNSEADEMKGVVDELQPLKIRFIVIEEVKSGFAAINKSNGAIDILCSNGFSDDTFICTTSDDGLISRTLLVRLKEAYDRSKKPLLVTSIARGQHAVGQLPHATFNLVAQPQNMRQCLVTGEQYWAHCDVFTGKLEYPRRHGDDDGLFIQYLNQQHPDWIEFLPDVWVAFNALQPGRWTDKAELERILNT